MRRRSILLGLGAAAAGGGVLGTGAFSSVSTDRTVTVSVADDNPSAYLGLDTTDDSGDGSGTGSFTNLPNGGAAQISNGELSIDLNGFAGTNDAYGASAGTTALDGIFEIINQSTQTLYVNIQDLSFADGDVKVQFYPGEKQETNLADGESEVKVKTGNSVPIGAKLIISDLSDNLQSPFKNDTTTVTATASSNDTTITSSDYEDPESS